VVVESPTHSSGGGLQEGSISSRVFEKAEPFSSGYSVFGPIFMSSPLAV
jgi:hypothetical protein